MSRFLSRTSFAVAEHGGARDVREEFSSEQLGRKARKAQKRASRPSEGSPARASRKDDPRARRKCAPTRPSHMVESQATRSASGATHDSNLDSLSGQDLHHWARRCHGRLV